MKADLSQLKTGIFKIKPGVPIEIEDLTEGQNSNSAEKRPELGQIGRTLKSYLAATKNLLDGKFSHLRDVVPIHMTDACQPLALVFSDGILIRYDLKSNPDLKILTGVVKEEGTLSDWMPRLSESFLHCPDQLDGFDPGDQTPSISLSLVSPLEQEKRELVKSRLYAVASLPKSKSGVSPTKAKRPSPIISIRNEFDIMMLGETAPKGDKRGREFITRTRIRLPFGWEAIEVYPPYDPNIWEPNLAHLWAETDLLAAVVRRNLRDSEFHAIDPNAQARKRMAQLISQCETLLNGPEEPLHQFIRANPQLLSPTHDRVWSKLPLGKRATDFVFREPSGEYLLVELENPSQLLFRKDGQPRQSLSHAVDQVIDWRRYLEDNLSTAQRELGLKGISSNPRSLIVIGRSVSLSEANRRKLVSIENATPTLKIMTFDDLLANSKATVENMLGPVWDTGPETEVYFRS
jgi:hypothetical protein